MTTAIASRCKQGSPDNSYDQVPYKSFAYPQTHPARLATIAALLGLQPPPIDRCRVLELGCCTGGNLIPVAEQFPQSSFLGIDLSSRQIADGQCDVEQIGLKNVQLERMDIADIGAELGQFDYIVAHGVYSWVPADVQKKILEICSQNLSPNGVAYVSYNTYPGWRLRGIVRDIMLYRVRSFTDPAERLSHARQLIDFLAQSVSKEESAYGALLKKELERTHNKNDQYLLHEELESNNEPIYFHEFIERAGGFGLQYLAEADFGSTCTKTLPSHVQTVLRNVSADVIELEQYVDFVRNRMFRQTLLCHNGVHVDREVRPERLLNLFVASNIKPEQPLSDFNSTEPVAFRGRSGITTTADPLLKSALMILGDIWPRPMPVCELVAMASERIDHRPGIVDPRVVVTVDTLRLLEPLIRCYETGQIELSVSQASGVTEVSQRPEAPTYARHQAKTANMVTNLRHEMVQLNDLERRVLQCLDGTRNVPAIQSELLKLACEGAIVVDHQGRAVREAGLLQSLLPAPVDQALKNLATWVLLRA